MGSIYSRDVIKNAESYIGYHEGSGNYNIFAEILDGVGYFKPQTKQYVAWCAVFCDCMLYFSSDSDSDEAKAYDAQFFQFQPHYNNYSAGAKEYAGYFMSAGAFHFDSAELGDIVFFNVGDNIGHVGIVTGVYDDDTLETVEGNAGDQVQKKWYNNYHNLIGGKIAGFGRPRYDGYEPSPTPPTPPTPPEPPKPTGDKYRVATNSGDALRVREFATSDSDQIGYISNGESITVSEIVEGESVDGVTEWAKTSDGYRFYPDYIEGYCSMRYLVAEPTPEPSAKIYRVHTNSGDSLRIRLEPNTDSEQVGYIPNGSEVNVLEIVEGESIDYVTEWGKVNYNGVVGYCSMRYLEEV